MKILFIGFIAFVGWSSMSTYIYVCMIKGLCYEANIGDAKEQKKLKNIDTIFIPILEEHAVIPQNQTILFAFDKAEYIADSEIDRYFENSIIYCNQNKLARLHIIGHTDAIGTKKYNMALGYRRAQNIKYYFKDNNSIYGRKQNRRAIITIKK